MSVGLQIGWLVVPLRDGKPLKLRSAMRYAPISYGKMSAVYGMTTGHVFCLLFTVRVDPDGRKVIEYAGKERRPALKEGLYAGFLDKCDLDSVCDWAQTHVGFAMTYCDVSKEN